MTRDHRPDKDDPHHYHQGMMDDGYWNEFTSDFGNYELGPAIGFGASSTVYEAIFTVPPSVYPTSTNLTIKPESTNGEVSNGRKPNLSIEVPVDNSGVEERICAVKISTSHPDVELLGREIKMLGLCKHPNVLRILSTFTLPPDHHRICLVTPFIPGGSLAGILNWRSRLITSPKTHHFPSFKIGHRNRRKEDEDELNGEHKGTLDEEEIKCVTKQVLDGLGYLHQNGFLHRDIKAGNLLIDEDGTILLADFGVGGDLNVPPSPVRSRKTRIGVDELKFDNDATPTIAQNGFGPGKVEKSHSGFRGGEDLKKKKSFVGTPNWMAPEVILGQKYDQKADVWSLGITLLELAHGAVPGAQYKPNKALSHIISDPSPTLDRSVGGYSRLMKEFIDLCLNKDPSARPTARDLMDHHWLKGAKKHNFLAQSLLAGVPPLAQRQELRRVPTKSSLLSRTSSWDFSTPNPSVPPTPMRNSLLIPAARSPSTSSHMEYFNSIGRSHSRNSSFSISAANSGLPPSPRVSLKQWALDKNYDENSLSLSFRTGSERGKSRRSLSSAGLRRGKSASVNFDHTKKGSFGMTTEEENTPISPASDFRSSQSQKVDGGALGNSANDPQPILGLISPIMEKSCSKESRFDDGPTPITGERTTGLGILNASIVMKQQIPVQSGLSESPEDILDLHRPKVSTDDSPNSSDQRDLVKQHGDGREPGVNDEPIVPGEEGQSQDKDILIGNDADANNRKSDSSSRTKTSQNGHSPKIPSPQRDQAKQQQPIASENKFGKIPIKEDQQPANNKIEKEKKNWLSRRSSMKRQEGKPIVTPLNQGQNQNQNKVQGNNDNANSVGGQSMGKTNSWQGVLGRVTGKMHKR